MAIHIGRREFITLLGGSAAWPLAARAQQPERMQRVGVLMNMAADDPEAPARVTAFAQGLQQSGWTDWSQCADRLPLGCGRCRPQSQIRGETARARAGRHAGHRFRGYGGVASGDAQVPIVFANVVDPVGAGFVGSLAQPGGNVTGFIVFEYVISAKWLELLKDIAPQLKRVAVLREPDLAAGIGQLAVIQAAAPSFGVEVRPVDVRDADEIERAVTAFARSSNGGLIVTGSPLTALHRKLIIALVARHRLPAVYPFRYFPTSSGLISYGPNTIDPFRRAAGYVDRILKGEKPADLPVQAPTKYELVINLKTAKALGLQIPDKLLALADEVIE